MMVTLGVDPHKASHTVVAANQVGRQLTQATTRATRTSDHQELIAWVDFPPGGGHRGYAAVVDGSGLMVACCCSHSTGDR
jgi:hypothetical protein